MDKVIIAALAGLAAHRWITQARAWMLPVGLMGAMVWGSTWIMISVGLMLTGFEFYGRAREFERQRDRQEQEAEVFLQRLAQLLPTRGGLSLALQDMGYRDIQVGREPNPERLLVGLFKMWNVNAVGMVASAAQVVLRHGGALQPVVEQAARKIAQDRERRFQRHLEEAAKRTTVVILGFAPYFMMVMLRFMVPSMYMALLGNAIGKLAVVGVGLVSGGVLLVLGSHVMRDGQSR